MCSTKLLLENLVSYWDQEAECFMIQGEWLEITLRDVHFLTGLPVLGMIGDTMSKLPRGVSAFVHKSYKLGCDIESLQTQAVAVMVLHILGSTGPHKISGGQLLMVESVLRGTYYGWS